MVALMKYGSGFPFHRLERLEGNLGIPLPATPTSWYVRPASWDKNMRLISAVLVIVPAILLIGGHLEHIALIVNRYLF
jgi:hypothetical protein